MAMRFEWDERKNRQNLRKHGISFELATEVFRDPFCLTIADRQSAAEERLWTLGRLPNLIVVVVVHVNHDRRDEEVIRIVSARKATAQERRLYEEAE